MKGYWEGLRPFEKRVVVGFAVLFFIVLNFLFVIPHFSDLATVRIRTDEAQRKLDRYRSEIAQTNVYARELRQFEGADVAAEEQSLQFANAIQQTAIQSGVQILTTSKINTQTNQFFLEKNESVSVQGGEEQLVNFLFKLGAGGSQIRVRDLGMRPDPGRMQLQANVKLVASYQKAKPAPKPAPSTARALAGTAAKPANSTSK
jgi:type II secretory pathway component PulM